VRKTVHNETLRRGREGEGGWEELLNAVEEQSTFYLK
jgi:hypothetical protein